MKLFAPSDTAKAYTNWKATCGPAAFAAVVGRPIMQCRSFFPKFPKQQWCNPTDMFFALRTAGVMHRKTPIVDGKQQLPAYGLAFVQIGGTWLEPGVPVGAAYRRTHWIGYASAGDTGWESQIYDINSEAWTGATSWKGNVLPRIIDHLKGDGSWFIRNAIEVTR